MTDQQLTAPVRVMHPATGELLEIGPATPLEDLAAMRRAITDGVRDLYGLAKVLDEEITRRADHEGTGTLHAGRLRLVVPKPTKTEWDVPQLSLTLEALVNETRISRAKASRALETIVTYKPRPAELNQLLTHADPEVARSVAACRRSVRQDRRVSVKGT